MHSFAMAAPFSYFSSPNRLKRYKHTNDCVQAFIASFAFAASVPSVPPSLVTSQELLSRDGLDGHVLSPASDRQLESKARSSAGSRSD